MNNSRKIADLAFKMETTDFGMTEILDELEPHAEIAQVEAAMVAVYEAKKAITAAYHALNKAASMIDLHTSEIKSDL